jgi:hypothetical protein
MLMVMMVLSLGGLARAEERPRLSGREAPRATDLLRAETLAERARERLRMPRQKSAGWKHGGSGWTSGGSSPPTAPPAGGSVTIRLSPGRRPRSRVDG